MLNIRKPAKANPRCLMYASAGEAYRKAQAEYERVYEHLKGFWKA